MMFLSSFLPSIERPKRADLYDQYALTMAVTNACIISSNFTVGITGNFIVE